MVILCITSLYVELSMRYIIIKNLYLDIALLLCLEVGEVTEVGEVDEVAKECGIRVLREVRVCLPNLNISFVVNHIGPGKID